MTTRRAALALLMLLAAVDAAAQGVVGGAFIVSRLPRETNVPAGVFALPPNGLTNGIAVFGGADVTPRVGWQGELSIPGEVETVVVSSHPGFTIEDATRHRDTILSGVVRVRAARWCEVV